jgi:hypothetical protein
LDAITFFFFSFIFQSRSVFPWRVFFFLGAVKG